MEGIEGSVLITGASRGLGAALAVAFGRRGARVAICARSGDSLRGVSAEVQEAGGTCLPAAVDVTDTDAVERWADEAARELGEPAVLINNASVLGPRAPLAEHSPGEWRETLDVNLTGTFLVTRAVLPRMLRAGQGSIVNVSSGAAVPPRTRWGAYAVSKLALEGFTQNLAAELDGTGVRVNAVDPGAMRTGMRATAYPEEDPRTLKRPEDTVGVFLWLASPASRGVTGERLRADDWPNGRES